MLGIEMPAYIRSLPIDPIRRVPVPWFVAWIDGKPEFRRAEGGKLILAIREKLCWVCGSQMVPGEFTFVLGPMCTVNRVSAEPPCHLECAIYSAKACPFLTKPHMVRRDSSDVPAQPVPGVALMRNPVATALWTTGNYKVSEVPNGLLFDLGRPRQVLWFTEGREATRAEVESAVIRGLPALVEMAKEDGPEAEAQLAAMAKVAESLWPSEAA